MEHYEILWDLILKELAKNCPAELESLVYLLGMKSYWNKLNFHINKITIHFKDYLNLILRLHL